MMTGSNRKRTTEKITEEEKRVIAGRSTTVSSLRLTPCVLQRHQPVVNTVVQPAVCLVRIINTVYTSSVSAIWYRHMPTSTTPPIRANKTAFPSQALQYRCCYCIQWLPLAYQMTWAPNGTVVKICSTAIPTEVMTKSQIVTSAASTVLL